MTPDTVHPATGKRSARRVLRSALLVILVNPYALVAAAIAIWLIAHLITTLTNGAHGHETWTMAVMLHCYACITALAIVAALALCHVLVTFLAGMKKD